MPGAAHLPDMVDHLVQEIAVVRDDQGRAVPLAQVAFQPFHRVDVQVVGRLVQDEQVGIGEQQARQHGARALPAGELRDGPVEIVRRRSPGRSASGGCASRRCSRRAARIMLQRAVAFQGVLCLVGVAHRRSPGGPARLPERAAQRRRTGTPPTGCACRSSRLLAAGSRVCRSRARLHDAGGGLFQSDQDAQQGGLADAIRPDDGDARPMRDAQGRRRRRYLPGRRIWPDWKR